MRIPYVITGLALCPEDLQDAMDGLVVIGERQVRRYNLPPLVYSGVVYERERRRAPLPGVERFQTPIDAYLLGHADCDGLAPWRAAELRARGIGARARVIDSPGVGYHVIVERESLDGSVRIEDPSAELGMLDGDHELDDDAMVSASKRRRRRARQFLGKTVQLIRKAGQAATAPQRATLMSAANVHARVATSLLERDQNGALERWHLGWL